MEANTSGVKSIISSTPIPSTTTRFSRLNTGLEKSEKTNDSFAFGDSLDNISWDQLNDDLIKMNEEMVDTSMKNMSTISTDLLTNRCVSPDLIDALSIQSDGSSKRTSSPSPSGKMGERVPKRPHSTTSSISLLNSDDSLFYSESSSDVFQRSDSEESSVSSVFQKTVFSELKIGDKFNVSLIDSNNISLINVLITKLKHKKTFALSFKTELKNQNPIQLIGSKIKSLKSMTQEVNGLDMKYNNTIVTALSVCFESENIVFYVKSQTALKGVRDQLKIHLKSDSKIIAFDVKSCYKILRQCFGLDLQILNKIDWFDLRVAHWILDPEADPPTDVKYLVRIHAKSYYHLYNSKNTSIENECTSTGLMFPVINALMSQLDEKNQLKALKRTEIPSRLTIADMELNGLCVDFELMTKQLDLLNQTKRQLESNAFEISNIKFKISKPEEVSKVLYEDMNLLSNYYSVQKNVNKPNSKGKYNRKLPKHLSTSKIALKKLMSLTNNPLPRIILDWRRVDYAIKKSVQSVLSCCTLDPKTGIHFINGLCDDWTSTGRISMYEPNLIGIVKDFSIDGIAFDEKKDSKQIISFSLRKCFIARKGYVLVSADYSQLELRILAHLSKDKELMRVLNHGGDVFKNIASVWKSKSIEHISDEERQQSKAVFN